jgi:hypothetical protein
VSILGPVAMKQMLAYSWESVSISRAGAVCEHLFQDDELTRLVKRIWV